MLNNAAYLHTTNTICRDMFLDAQTVKLLRITMMCLVLSERNCYHDFGSVGDITFSSFLCKNTVHIFSQIIIIN